MSALLRLFRKDKGPIWQQLSKEIGAEFIPGKGFRGHDAIKAYHENWTIIIDTYKKGRHPTVTRIRAPYVNRDSFSFRLYRDGVGSSIKKVFGMQDVKVGYEPFDKDFIIQGSDEKKLRMLFDHQRIRGIISVQPDIFLETNTDENWSHDPWGEGISELRFQVQGIVSDLDQLHDLYNLFADLLNHLCHIGSAYEDDPFL